MGRGASRRDILAITPVEMGEVTRLLPTFEEFEADGGSIKDIKGRRFLELYYLSGGEAYQFDDLIILGDPYTDQLFYAMDSGCSCPIPFENATLADLMPLTKTTFNDMAAAARGLTETSLEEAQNAIDVARKLLGIT